MADKIYPSLNKLYSAFVVAIGVAAGSFLSYVGISNSSDLAASFLVVVIALIAAAGSILTVYRASRLRVSNEGISSGEIRFKWGEVTDVRRFRFGIHFCAGDRKIVLAPYAYKNPDELIKFVEGALAKAS